MNKQEDEKKYNECIFYESAARVVHDINSPIATIEMCLFSLSQESQNEMFMIIKSALQNIRDITQNFHSTHYANHLKIKSKNSAHIKSNHHESLHLKSLIESVIIEKRVEWIEKKT
jgi:hypothetical protein